MEDLCLTSDERKCLQMWFRQALVQVEKEEAVRSLLSESKQTPTKSTHPSFSIRRARRGRSILKELVN